MLPATSAFAVPTGSGDQSVRTATQEDSSLRVATIATNLSGENPEDLYRELLGGADAEASRVADAITAAKPDVVVLTGMDAEPNAVAAFQAEYLGSDQDERPNVYYPYSYLAVGVKGQQSGADLDDDRVVGGPGDAWGQGAFNEQASTVVLSRYPIDQAAVSSVTELKWKDVEGNRLKDSNLKGALAASIPVMNNGLWDIPIEFQSERIHVVAAQTEPLESSYNFAAPRQNDELKVVSDYLNGAEYVRTDQGKQAKPLSDQRVVLTGSLAQRSDSFAGVDALAQQLGADEPLNSSGNYLIPSQNWSIVGQGRIGGPAPAAFQPLPGATPDVVESSELIWTDIKF